MHSSLRCVEGSRKAGSQTGLKDEGENGTERTLDKANRPIQFSSPTSLTLPGSDATERNAVVQK